jgi:hypothetical protein
MTEGQYRSWYENKVRGNSARAKYMAGTLGRKALQFRFKIPALIADLEGVLKEAKNRAKTIK